MSVDNRDESTQNSRDAVRRGFALALQDNWLMQTAVTTGCEIQTFLEGYWTESIPPVGIFPTSFINP